MANNIFTVNLSGNYPKSQAALAGIQAYQYNPWGKWMTWNTKGKKPVTPNGSIESQPVQNSPIVVQRELMKNKQGGTKLEVKTIRYLTGHPKMGNEQLSGLVEEPKINYAHVYINEDRWGVKVRDGNMAEQVLSAMGLPEWAKGALQRHWAMWCGFAEIPSAFYKGLSYSVLNSTIFASDANVVAHSHPHIYTAGGSGKVAYTAGYPGTTAYEQSVATAIDAVGESHILTAGLFRNLNADDQYRMLPYLFTKDGTPFRAWALHSYGMAQLRNDPDIKQAHINDAFRMAGENPMLTGMQIFYEGNAFFDFGNGIWPVATSGGLPVWGPTITDLTSFNSYPTANRFAAICLGDNALFHATGWDMAWTGETRDHNHVEEIGYTIGSGFARNDSWNRDDGSKGQFLINEGSVILIHRADKPALA